MSPNKLILFWRKWMALMKGSAGKKKPASELPFEVVPVAEDAMLFQVRKEEVQILLTRMVLGLHRRGRPRKEEKEESRAA